MSWYLPPSTTQSLSDGRQLTRIGNIKIRIASSILCRVFFFQPNMDNKLVLIVFVPAIVLVRVSLHCKQQVCSSQVAETALHFFVHKKKKKGQIKKKESP